MLLNQDAFHFLIRLLAILQEPADGHLGLMSCGLLVIQWTSDDLHLHRNQSTKVQLSCGEIFH